ncbi:MAG: hypothetical protein MUC97_19265 [Bernardetiaceae bacterium]|jgi:hypothetical protein|nr:hypothetical protein [Bernardetiaceae bacterium]
MKNLFFADLLLGVLATCQPKCPGDRNLPPDAIDSGLFFLLAESKTGQSFFPIFAQPTGLKITDTQGREYPFGIEATGRFQMFYFILKTPEDLAGLDTKASKTFYLRLSASDTDTIRYIYRLKVNDCKEPEVDFSAVQVWFNGQQAGVSSIANGFVFKNKSLITIKKL